MLSSVLHSPKAVQVNIAIMRAFVELRQVIASHTQLVRRIDELEQKYDHQFKVVFDAIRELMKPPESPARKPIGFQTEGEERGKKGRGPRMARRSVRKKK